MSEFGTRKVENQVNTCCVKVPRNTHGDGQIAMSDPAIAYATVPKLSYRVTIRPAFVVDVPLAALPVS